MVLIMCIHDAGVGGGGEVPLKCVKMGWSIEAWHNSRKKKKCLQGNKKITTFQSLCFLHIINVFYINLGLKKSAAKKIRVQLKWLSCTSAANREYPHWASHLA